MDKVTKIGQGSIIQHGSENDRIYLMKLQANEAPQIIEIINQLALNENYSKIFCKVPASCAPLFLSNGYFQEAQIPGFFKGKEDVFLMSKYRDSDRLIGLDREQMSALHHLLSSSLPNKKETKSSYQFRRLNESDIDAICNLFEETFDSYPFPVYDPEYIRETMKDDVIYFGAERNGQLAAIASSEMDKENLNAEMTDFATSEAHRGQRLASHLLSLMEDEMQKIGIQTLYTIARLQSIPMNKTFLRQGYKYSGTLIKNTNIAGQIESMNIYYKRL